MKIHPVGAEFFHEDTLTEKKKLIVAIRNFANTTKRYISQRQMVSHFLRSFICL